MYKNILYSFNNFFKSIMAVYKLKRNLKKQKNENLELKKEQCGLVQKKDENDEKKYICNGCGICKSVCPSKNAIEISKENEKIQLKYDITKCIFCGNCTDNCPNNAIEFSKDIEPSYEKNQIEVIEWK